MFQPNPLRTTRRFFFADGCGPPVAMKIVQAAKQGKSVSRLVGEMLQKLMHESHEYDEAMWRYLSRKPYEFEKPGGRLPTRDELYDRASVRRR